MNPTTGETVLSEELAAIDSTCPDWHAFCTGTVCWAVSSHTPWHGGGITLDAPTPELLRHEIARQQRTWEREAA